MAVLPGSKTTWRGVRISDRTRKALIWAERMSGVTIALSQGSWSTSVSASGSTHAGSGVVDVKCASLSAAKKKRLLRALKDAGFAAWLRGPADGMPVHIHACLLSDPALSPAAKWQCSEYDRGKSGLTSAKADTETYRPDPKVKFSWVRNKPVAR